MKGQVSLASMVNTGGGQSIAVSIQGADTAVLAKLAAEVEEVIRKTPGTIDVTNSAVSGSPEMRVEIDHEKLSDLGLATAQVASAVRTALDGTVATELRRENEDKVDIRVLYSASTTDTELASIPDIPLTTATGAQVKLSQVATLVPVDGPSAISRLDRVRKVTQVAQAQAGLEAAEARRDTVKKGATEADMQGAQSAVDSATANLKIAQARLDALKIGPTQAELVTANANVNSTLATWKAAQANLDEVKAGPRPAEIQAAEAQVESARAALYAADDKKSMYNDASNDVRLAAGMTSGSQVERAATAAEAAYDAAVEKLNLLRSKPLPVELADAQSKGGSEGELRLSRRQA